MKKRTDKENRYAKIREIITREPVSTQQMLTEALRKEHIDVTQATVSRDIKNLRLVKVFDGAIVRYAYPADENGGTVKNRLEQLLSESVVSVDFSENIIVLKTLPGTANSIGAALDEAAWPEIIGTLAGDDTILAVVKPKDAVENCFKRIVTLWGRGNNV